MCMPSPGTTSEGKCAESWNCAVSGTVRDTETRSLCRPLLGRLVSESGRLRRAARDLDLLF
jgi:hypothetical protein